jgi:hypothetical protein
LGHLTNCVTMAEGGGIGPRSNKEQTAYKAAPAAKQSPSGRAKRTLTMALVGASSKKSRLGPLCYGLAHGENDDALDYVSLFMFTIRTPQRSPARFPQRFTLDLFGKDAKNGLRHLRRLSRCNSHPAKDSRKGSLAGLPFHFDASMYSMHGEACGCNVMSVENATIIGQCTAKVTAT